LSLSRLRIHSPINPINPRTAKLSPVPSLIETRPFTIHPELYAWPSFRIFSERVVWMYLLLITVLTLLLVGGMRLSIPLALLAALVLVGIAFGMSFLRYKNFLRRPANREIYRNCVVSLDDEGVRQDYTDGSFVEIKLFAVKTFREVGDYYFVFANPQYGIVIPKTAFESPEESKEFAERIKTREGKAG
jgi:hypothetical protein